MITRPHRDGKEPESKKHRLGSRINPSTAAEQIPLRSPADAAGLLVYHPRFFVKQDIGNGSLVKGIFSRNFDSSK